MGRSSTPSARKTRRLLRKLLFNAEVVNSDPWHLPSVFFLTSQRDCSVVSSRRTVSGYWKYTDGSATAIRSRESFSSTTTIPCYAGFRETLKFYLKDGTKTNWVMHQYNHFDYVYKRGDPLFLQDEVMICKVFKKDATHETSSSPSELRGRIPSTADDVRTMHLFTELQDVVDSLLESTTVDPNPTVHCDTHAKSDDDGDVWQHFTKIRTKNPGVVYAVCHRCDRALKAHCSKEYCISQLKRHMKSDKCRSSCSNPSTDEDREMLHLLRSAFDPYEQQKREGKLQCQEVNGSLTQMDPWVLGHNIPCYVTTSLNLQTNEGWWEEIEKEFTAIRVEQQQQMQGFWMEIGNGITTEMQHDYQMQMQVPQYMGLRRTLEFHHNQNDGGNKLKTTWIMLEYQLLDVIQPPTLLLQGDMVIRKVSHCDKDAVASAFSDMNRWLNGDDDSAEYSYKGKNVNMDSTLSTDYMHAGGDRKRKRSAASKRTSKVWLHFTEIRTADHDVVYAVCHHCDRGYGSARSTNGTSHLWRHKKSCTSKLPGTGNVNNGASASWEAEIWPLFLLFKNYKETEHQASGMC